MPTGAIKEPWWSTSPTLRSTDFGSTSRRPSRILILICIALLISYHLFDVGLPDINLKETGDTAKPRHAYATFLAGDGKNETANIHEDNYFVATRILAYQLKHAPETRTTHHYPFIVVVTPEVTERKRDRLRKDGAIVVEKSYFEVPSRLQVAINWNAMYAKLRLWEMTESDLICYIDGDTILTRSLDGIFEDPAVLTRNTTSFPEGIKEDEAPLPKSYVFAGVREVNEEHKFPPTENGVDWSYENYLNGGFFVMRPSLELLEHYLSILHSEIQLYSPWEAEQNLLNYAHKRIDGGNIPWQYLDVTWNIHAPDSKDLRGGVASVHDKFWGTANKDKALETYMNNWKGRMEGYWEGRQREAAILGKQVDI